MASPTIDSEQVRSIVESDQPLSDLTPLFPSRLAALECYADLMGEKWLQAASAQCAACGEAAPARQETYLWQASVNTARTILASLLVSAITILGRRIVSYQHDVEFATSHCFCHRCGRSAALKRGLATTLHQLLFALLLLSLIATVLLLVMFGTALVAAHELIVKAGLWLLVSLLPLAVAYAGFRFCRQLRIPAALRQIGRHPFAVREVHRVN